MLAPFPVPSLLQVYFSRDCADSLVRLPDGHLRAQVLQQLHRLAKGTWPPQLRPHNAVAAKYQPILQVHYVLDMYLVWMVDVDQSTCTQVGPTACFEGGATGVAAPAAPRLAVSRM